MSYIYPKREGWLEGFKYKSFEYPENRCAVCKNSYCHNPGANITGLSCKEIDKFMKQNKIKSYTNKKGEHVIFTSVVNSNDLCNKFIAD